MKPVLTTLGKGCFAYDVPAQKYYKGRGGIEPTSVVNTAALKDDSDRTSIQSVYVQRGPLLYSYAIPQNKTEDTKVYANMHGRVPGDPSFKCWSFEPADNWNYAIDMTSEVKL